MRAITAGIKAENLAASYLQQQNIDILQRNFHCKFGEIDIVAQENSQLMFVEVRYRKSAVFGSAAESVAYTKQQKLIRTAEHYLQTHNSAASLNCRFDIIAISDTLKSTQIEWIKDAFNA